MLALTCFAQRAFLCPARAEDFRPWRLDCQYFPARFAFLSAVSANKLIHADQQPRGLFCFDQSGTAIRVRLGLTSDVTPTSEKGLKTRMHRRYIPTCVRTDIHKGTHTYIPACANTVRTCTCADGRMRGLKPTHAYTQNCISPPVNTPVRGKQTVSQAITEFSQHTYIHKPTLAHLHIIFFVCSTLRCVRV